MGCSQRVAQISVLPGRPVSIPTCRPGKQGRMQPKFWQANHSLEHGLEYALYSTLENTLASLLWFLFPVSNFHALS